MRKIILFTILAFTMIFMNSCKDDATEITELKYITLESASKKIVVEENSTLNSEFTIFSSDKVNEDRIIELNITTSMSDGNYTVPNSVTIPANSNEVKIPLEITDNGLNRMGESMSIQLNTPEDYFLGNPKLDLSISVLCPSALEGNWRYTSGNGKSITITKISEGNYTIEGDDRFGANYSFDISDACGNLTISNPFIQTNFGIATSGSGTVSADKSTITILYTVDGFFTDRKMVLVRN